MKRAAAIYSGLFCVCFGIFTAAWTVVFVAQGKFLNGLVTLGTSTACFAFIIAFVAMMKTDLAPRVTVDGAGTTFRATRFIDVPFQIGLVGVVTACAVYTVFAPAEMVTISIPPAMRYSLPFSCGILLLMTVPLVWRNLRRGGLKYLRMTTGGFELEDFWRSGAGKWEEVVDISGLGAKQQSAKVGEIVFVMSDDSTPKIAAGSITPNGTALRELVRFYWEHPESRDELTDGAAVERLARSLA